MAPRRYPVITRAMMNPAYSRRMDRGWATATLLETDNAGDASWTAQVCVDSRGNAIAVWTQSDGDQYNTWANRFQ